MNYPFYYYNNKNNNIDSLINYFNILDSFNYYNQ